MEDVELERNKKMIPYDEMDNTELQAQARSLHGSLYKRINTLQRDLNILRETYKKAKAYIQELETVNRDLSTIQTRPTRVTVQFPNEKTEVIYKLVRE